MGRRRKPPAGARPIDGWLNIDKPVGMTSAAVVSRLRRQLRPHRIGHAGTLDPLASGILPIALGEATKTVAYAMDAGKQYRFTIRFGIARDTDDCEGAITAESPIRPAPGAIEAVLPRFTGEIDQVPPAYSALRVDGRRAYALARAGEAPVLAARPVRVDSLTLVDCPDPDHAVIDVTCGKGFYVRSLARDLAAAVGTVGHVSALRRTRVGAFTEEGAIILETEDPMGHSARVLKHLLPIETVLDDIPALAVTEKEADTLRQGRPLMVPGSGGPDPRGTGGAEGSPIPDGTVVIALQGDRPVALTRWNGSDFRPVRVFNLNHGEHDVDYGRA